jgi:hypothetical protein
MTLRLLACLLLLIAGCVDAQPEEVGTSASEVAVTWTNLVGVTASGNDLTKTAGTSAWDAGAVSVETLTADGYVELAVGETGTNKAAGLSSGDGGQHYSDIDFALRFTASGAVQVYEGGTLRGSFGTYAAGDRFRIEVEGGVITYRRAGAAPFYTSALAPSFPLGVDTAFYTPGATINDVELVATGLTWQNIVGVAVAGDGLTKTDGTSGWTAGASSVQTLAGDGFMEFAVADATTAKAAGLSSGDSGQSYTDIDFALRLGATGKVQVFESGSLRGSFGTYLAGDRFRVEVSGGVVSYSMNGGVPFYTSAVPPAFPLGIDTSFNTPGATLNDFALVDAINACPAYAGNGLVCSGSFTVDSPAELAAVATCARITGDLVINPLGVAEISLPVLERIDGRVRVASDPNLVRLRLPQLKEAPFKDSSTGYDGVFIELATSTSGVDLSRLRTTGDLAIQKDGAGQTSLPCLDTTDSLRALRWNGSRWIPGSLHVPRLRQVGSIDVFGELDGLTAVMTAPRLERVAGGVGGRIVAPVLTSVTGSVDAVLDAPNLTDIGSTLNYRDADNLPSLRRVRGDVVLGTAASIDLPSLEYIGGALGRGYEWPTASILVLPALVRVGSLQLTWPSLQEVSLPALSLIRGNLASYVAVDLPALNEITGVVWLHAPVNAPALVSIRRSLRLEEFDGAVSFPALASVGDISCSTGAATSIDLPALTQLQDSIDVRNCDNLTSISAPLLQSVGGYIYIALDDALAALDLGSLTSLDAWLSINRNRNLPNCYATNIHDQLLASGWTGDAYIYNNDGTGTCP